MAFTKTHAKLLVGMMAPSDLDGFRFICGKSEETCSYASTDVIAHLEALGLIRLETYDSEKTLALLTANGKKVKEFV